MVTEVEGGIVRSDLTLLDIVARLQELETAGVTELASEVGVAKSTVHKHLKTLERANYVHNDGGTYRLGLKFLEHGGHVRAHTRMYSVGRKAVMDLSEETGEMVLLAMKDFDRGTFVFRSKDPFGLMQAVPIGQRFPFHQNAAGKAMLAELSDETVGEIIDRTGLPVATDRTIADREVLFDRLEDVRNRGYAINVGEKSEGVWAVSAAVLDPMEETLGAISITVPESATSEQKLTDEYSNAVIETASALNLRLKHEARR